MNNETKASALLELTSDFLHRSDTLVDNIFSNLWNQVGMGSLLKRCGFHNRSGIAVNTVVYCLAMWVWLRFGLHHTGSL